MNIPDTLRALGWQFSCRTDPASALGDLFRQQSRPLFRYALSLCAQRSAAEDAVQEVFVRLSSDLPGLARINNPRAYLYRAVRNQLQQRRIEWTELPEEDALASPTLSLEDRTDLLQALASLPQEQRELVFLKEVLKLSFREIAEALEISLNTAASRHRYGLEKLRQALEKEPSYA